MLNSKVNLGKRITSLRKKSGISQTKLAMELNRRPSAITNWEKGDTSPSADTIVPLCRLLNTDPNTLFDFPTKQPIADQALRKYSKLTDKSRLEIDSFINYKYFLENKPKLTVRFKNYQKEVETVTLPIFEDVAAAGFGNYLNYGLREFSNEIFDADVVPKKCDAGVKIRGNSMEPIIKSGDIVFIKYTPKLDDGDIGIFIYGDEFYCKKLCIDHKNKRIVLQSLNEEYEDIVVYNPESLSTLGKVILR